MPIELNVCRTGLYTLLFHTSYFPLYIGLTVIFLYKSKMKIVL